MFGVCNVMTANPLHQKKLKQVQKEFILHGLGAVCVGIILMIGVIYTGSIRDRFLQQKQGEQIEINSLTNRLEEMTRKTKEINEAMKLWQKLNIQSKKREGLKIDKANEIIENLKKRLKLGAIEIDLSAPQELSDIYKTDTVSVVSSDMNLKIKALTDEQIFSFLELLLKELPGYIKLESVTIRRNIEITPDSLQKIIKGEYPELISAEIIFKWRDLKDLQVQK